MEGRVEKTLTCVLFRRMKRYYMPTWNWGAGKDMKMPKNQPVPSRTITPTAALSCR